jgi:hypothetical protein
MAKSPWAAGGAICAGLFAFAFVAAPASCEWGLAAYFGAGIVSVAALAGAPFVLHGGAPLGHRAAIAVTLVALGCGVWLLGLFVANVRIICRLF